MAVALGLAGSGIAALALVDSPAGSTMIKRASQGGRPGPRVPVSRSASSRAALRLLGAAAAACQDVSYSGVQVVAWWGDDGPSTSVVEVWHQPGRRTVAQAAATATTPAGASLSSWLTADRDPDGLLGMSARLLALMQSNYQLIYAGGGQADSRSAQIIEVRRADGGVAARFWLDTSTKLPLRREIFDALGRVISEDAFIDLQVGAGGLGDVPATAAQPWTGQPSPATLTALRARGWPLPSLLPGNLTLFAVSQTSTKAGPVLELTYSDGLSVVSLFVQRGQLPAALPGWQQVALQGHDVYAADPDSGSLAWSADGFVFTLIADAPPAIVDQVVTALPHSAKPGFLGRIGRGFRRLATWVNPFG